MESVKCCSLCGSFDKEVRYLPDPVKPPDNIFFYGINEMYQVLRKLLIPIDENHQQFRSCIDCEKEFHQIYSFIKKCMEAKNMLYQLKNSSVSLKRMAELPLGLTGNTSNCKRQKNKKISSPDVKRKKSKIKQEIYDLTVDLQSNDNDEEEERSDYLTDIDRRLEDILIPNIILQETKHDYVTPITIFDTIISEVNDQSSRENEFYGTRDVFDNNSSTYARNDGYSCDECGKIYSCKRSLVLHKEGHAGIKYPCNKCDASYARKTSLNEHMRKHTGEMFKCDQCNAQYATSKSLRYHKRKHTGNTFDCTKCNARFVRAAALRIHMRTHIRKKETNNSGALKRPMNTHRDIRFNCELCDGTFSRSSSLKRHLLIHYNGKYRCSQCNATYGNPQDLADHENLHFNTNHDCSTCNVKFPSAEELITHLQTHSNQTKTPARQIFKCDLCNVEYFRKCSLAEHKRIHDGNTFDCDVCGVSYKTSQSLKYHKRLHSGESFDCDRCSKRYVRADYLRKHMVIHLADALDIHF